jgi:serpin B
MTLFPKFLLSTLLLGLLSWSACEKDIPDPPDPTVNFSCTETPDACALSTANGHFAIDLWQQLTADEAADQNIFISPFSISTALTMTLNGADGDTYEQMQTVLRTEIFTREVRNEAFQTLLTTLPYLDPHVQLELANSIWPREDYPVRAAFLQENETYFNSEVIPISFADMPAVISQVNNWIADKTNGLIEDALTELPSNVVMLLINAIYFQGDWQVAFDPEDTYPAEFQSAAGPQNVDMMHLPEVSMPYFETDRFQAVDLAYGDSIFSMSVFVPKPGYDVHDISAQLTAENWATWTSSFVPTDIELSIPKFKMEYEVKLKKSLVTMGMGTAFSDAADFSKLVEGGGVKIDEVIHKAFVEVNEAGTEAAAVTVVIIVETSVPQIPVVKADRPFLFVIRDNQTNSILFMGRLSDPS